MIKKLSCKRHKQALFYVYLGTQTGQLYTVCQMCEDEINARKPGKYFPWKLDDTKIA